MGKIFTHTPSTVISLPLFTTLITTMIILACPTQGQSSSSVCTGAMISNMGSCVGFLTSGSNLSRPSSHCCDSLRDLMSNGQDCLCLVITGGVPFQVPINRNLAISLPRACRASGVPIECKATATRPVSTPAGQDGNSGLDPLSPMIIPQPFTPPSPEIPGGGIIPTLTPPGMRPTLTPSTAQRALPSLLVAMMGVIIMFN